MDYFNVSSSDSIVIYGAAHLGKEALYRLKKQGIKVTNFLDKRAEDLVEVEGIEVIHPDSYHGDKDHTVVILAVSNPMSVANRLYQLGFRKLIYKVIQQGTLPSDVRRMNTVFYLLMRGGGIKSIDNIPYYDLDMDTRFINSALVHEDESEKIVYIPLDLIFVKSENRHIFTYSKFLKYIRAFSLQQENSFTIIDNYSKNHNIEAFNGWEYELTAEERRSYTQATLNEFNLRIEFGMDYFEKNPIRVTFENKKFYIEDEYLFRVMFFLSKEVLHIPARMSNQDYEAWINRPFLNKVIDYAKKHDLFTSYSMLEHPYMYNFPTARDIGGNSRFVKIGNFIDETKLDIKGKKIVDIGAYFGVMSRFFARLGAQVTSVEMNPDEYGFEVLLNEILNFDDIKMFCGIIQDLKTDEQFDIAILMNVLHWHLKTGVAAEIVQAVNRITTKYLLWESGDEPEIEKKLIIDNSQFKHYTKICTTVGTGKIRELGFWSKIY